MKKMLADFLRHPLLLEGVMASFLGSRKLMVQTELNESELWGVVRANTLEIARCRRDACLWATERFGIR